MQDFQSQAESILKSEMTNAGLEITPKKNGREGVDFLIKSPTRKQYELFLQPADLIALQSVKIPKEQLGEPQENLWVALIGFIPNAEPLIYKIPVEISYDTTVKTALISLEIIADAKLDLLLEDSEIVKVNDQGIITLKFINNGLTQIKFLKVTLEESGAYEILSPKELYIGEVDIDDFEDVKYAEFILKNYPIMYQSPIY